MCLLSKSRIAGNGRCVCIYCCSTDKLNYYGIRGVPLDWLASYLSNRQQYVMIKFLQTIRLYVGFPKVQSSVLFFSSSILMIFFSPLNILRLFSLLMIQIFFCVIKICLHQELLLVSSWFRANKPTVLRTNLNLSFFIRNVKRLISQELKNIFLTIPLCLVYRKTIF